MNWNLPLRDLATIEQLYETAMEEGAASICIGKYEWIKVTDTGAWYHETIDGERRIDQREVEIRRLHAYDPEGGWLEDLADHAP